MTDVTQGSASRSHRPLTLRLAFGVFSIFAKGVPLAGNLANYAFQSLRTKLKGSGSDASALEDDPFDARLGVEPGAPTGQNRASDAPEKQNDTARVVLPRRITVKTASEARPDPAADHPEPRTQDAQVAEMSQPDTASEMATGATGAVPGAPEAPPTQNGVDDLATATADLAPVPPPDPEIALRDQEDTDQSEHETNNLFADLWTDELKARRAQRILSRDSRVRVRRTAPDLSAA